MPCVNPDGTLSPSGQEMLKAVAAGQSATATEVVTTTRLPLFRVRAGLRELTKAGLLEYDDSDERFSPTTWGLERVESDS